VGKSSLFNRLIDQASALVANEPGTTRDYLTGTLELDTATCRLCDTAGVEPAESVSIGGSDASIRQSAQQLGTSLAQHGDLRLLCIDMTRPLNPWEAQQLAANPSGPRLVVLTKSDGQSHMHSPPGAVVTSALADTGLDALRRAIREALSELAHGESAAFASASRCAESLRAAADSLARAGQLNETRSGEELVGSELRLALDELGKVVGTVYTDDILDRVFSRFCIGK
jgi:tRNA modification GTPase